MDEENKMINKKQESKGDKFSYFMLCVMANGKR